MRIVSLAENITLEKRVSVTPEIAKKYISLGLNIFLPKSYGAHLGFSDEEYKNIGINF